LSQSCDIRQGYSILFAELTDLPENKLSVNNIKKRVKGIRNIIRDETRFYYFPPMEQIEFFKKPKLLDFKSLFLIPYEFFQNNIQYFYVCRLKEPALKVLIDKITRFFSRLAFEDIMFLNGDEIKFHLGQLSGEDRSNAEMTLRELKK